MKDTLTAAVLLIGNELLSGSVQDKNLAHIAVTLEQRGIRVRETRIIPDIEKQIIESVNDLRSKYHYVFTTGGIGPTHDDITSESIAKAFGVNNVVQQSVFDLIQQHCEDKGSEFTPAAQRMAYAPEGAELIETDKSILPGYRVDNVFVMAGVPRIMQIMLNSMVQKLETGRAVLCESVHADASEGEIAEALEQIQFEFKDIDIGSYPQDKGSTLTNYQLILLVRGTDQRIISNACEKILNACKLGGYPAVKVT